MLNNLIRGVEKTNVLLVKDSKDNHGNAILLAIVQGLLSRNDILFLQYELNSQYWIEAISGNESPRTLSVVCCEKDLLCWEPDLQNDLDITGKVTSHRSDFMGSKFCVVLDCLSSIIMHRTPAYTCRMLQKVAAMEDVENVVCLVHEDLHDDVSVGLLEHTANTVIQVLPSTSGDHNFCCKTLHKKKTGKVHIITEHFNLDSLYGIKDLIETKPMKTPTNDPEQPIDPAANLTFNLSLSEKEKEARSQVKLPYLYDQQRQEDTLTRSVGEGKIFYQPDEADDFDEEDPDEDLNI